MQLLLYIQLVFPYRQEEKRCSGVISKHREGREIERNKEINFRVFKEQHISARCWQVLVLKNEPKTGSVADSV